LHGDNPAASMAVGRGEVVWRADAAGPGAGAMGPAAFPDVDPDRGRAQAVDHVDDRARIGIEQRAIVEDGRLRGRRARRRAGGAGLIVKGEREPRDWHGRARWAREARTVDLGRTCSYGEPPFGGKGRAGARRADHDGATGLRRRTNSSISLRRDRGESPYAQGNGAWRPDFDPSLRARQLLREPAAAA